jgi:hypothetical protein
LQFERELVSGISGLLRNQITIFRTTRSPSTAHYSIIESVTDSFGNVGTFDSVELYDTGRTKLRLEVGDVVSFTCRGSDERGRELEWFVEASLPPFRLYITDATSTIKGASPVIQWTPAEGQVGEKVFVWVKMRAVGSRFRKVMTRPDWQPDYDDARVFTYAVNPPRE